MRAPDDDAGPLDEEARLAADEHRQGALAREVAPRRRCRGLLEPTFAPGATLSCRASEGEMEIGIQTRE